MSAFKEELFFSGEAREAVEELRALGDKIRRQIHGRLAALYDRRAARMESLLFWLQRRQAVVRASAPRPFLFSELKALLSGLSRGKPGGLPRPEFPVTREWWLTFRLTDLAEALLGTLNSLRSATGKDVSWRFLEGEDSVSAVFSFRSGFDAFDLRKFCQQLAWQGNGCPACEAGFPFLEAVLENGRGSFIWRFRNGRWSLEITLPAMSPQRPPQREEKSSSSSFRRE